ncbi:MAG: photosystem II biogenesis protein Psp29 [Cyanothece sp. SIO1E1]|nr:photosystem II biogenesis protein Psp29 [Cyanothece sp. SIO1E1]
MNNVRTVSDTKRSFYTYHTRPINSIYRRVVEELIVEMHLLSVNVDFCYDPIYALGVTTSFDRFMQGYQPDSDRIGIFNALCQSIEQDPQQYRRDAEQLQSAAAKLSTSDLVAQIKACASGTNEFQKHFQAVAENPQFKYSRLFAIGLYTLLEATDAELVKDEKQRDPLLAEICEALKLTGDKLQKDLELYRSNLDKVTQAQIVMQDIIAADRKKREQRAESKDAVAAPQNGSPPDNTEEAE